MLRRTCLSYATDAVINVELNEAGAALQVKAQVTRGESR